MVKLFKLPLRIFLNFISEMAIDYKKKKKSKNAILVTHGSKKIELQRSRMFCLKSKKKKYQSEIIKRNVEEEMTRKWLELNCFEIQRANRKVWKVRLVNDSMNAFELFTKVIFKSDGVCYGNTTVKSERVRD